MRYSGVDNIPWKSTVTMKLLDGVIDKLKKFGPI